MKRELRNKFNEMIKDSGVPKDFVILRDRWHGADKDYGLKLTNRTGTIKIGNKSFKTLHFNFKSSDTTLPDNKKLNTDIWYEEKTLNWVKATFKKSGNWEYRLKLLD